MKAPMMLQPAWKGRQGWVEGGYIPGLKILTIPIDIKNVFMALLCRSVAMDNYRLKIKIGEHEFEAEGPEDAVRSQFEAFKELIANPPQPIGATTRPSVQGGNSSSLVGDGDVKLDKICRVEGRVVSLTVKPEAEATAAQLIMLGQKVYRENDTVTASQIKDGLERSGYRPTRIDRIMQPLEEEGSVTRFGQRKGTRYRFTNPGLAKAKNMAKEAIERVS
jgi:hypothetical protein